MKSEEYLEKMMLIKKLVAAGKTGSPKELAKRLNVSERTVRRFVEQLRRKQPGIIFCRNINSYVEK